MKVDLNPAVLEWARRSAHLSITDAAKKIGVSEDKLRLVESGNEQLTYRQLKDCGRAYSRPVAAFFMDEVFEDHISLTDFRLHDPSTESYPSSRVSAEMRRAIQMREDALMLYSLLGIDVGKFTLAASLSENVEVVGKRIRAHFDTPPSLRTRREDAALKEWKSLIEDSGVLVFEVSRVASNEMRGMCIFFDELPIIILNGGETHAARLFSLLHEFTHLLLRQNALCDMSFTSQESVDQKTEVFCNAVAAATLMPLEDFLKTLPAPDSPREWDEPKIEELARLFGVSREAVLRRMLTLRYTTINFYRAKRQEYRSQYDASKARKKELGKSSSGGPEPSVMTLRNRGRRFTSIVLDAYHGGQIGLSTVSDFLGLKLKHIERLESLVGAA